MATKTTYPPGGTWFDTLRNSFFDVPVNASHDNAIETTAFLEAATSCSVRGPMNTEVSPLLHTLLDLIANLSLDARCPRLGRIYSCEERHLGQHQGVLFLVSPACYSNTHRLTESIIEQKVRDRQLAAPAESENLQSLVLNELKIKKHTATEGLLWLVRFISSAPQLCMRLG